MKLKMLYDLDNRPSTAYLAHCIAEYGYDSYTPITDSDYNIIGNIWYDPGNPDRSDYTELQNLLTAEHPTGTFEIIE